MIDRVLSTVFVAMAGMFLIFAWIAASWIYAGLACLFCYAAVTVTRK